MRREHGAPATAAGRRPQGSATADFLKAQAPVLSIALFFLLMVLLFGTATDAFTSRVNLLNLLRQSAPLLIVAVAMTFVITTGGIDLSVGSTVALVNALAAILLQAALPWPLVVLAMLVLGGLVGAMQGWFVAWEGIPAFIVTLAGLSVLRGVALLLTQGFSIPISPDSWFVQLGRGWFLGVPLPAVLAVVAAVAGWMALTQTAFGRYVTAIGANTRGGPPGRHRRAADDAAGLCAERHGRGGGRHHHRRPPRLGLVQRGRRLRARGDRRRRPGRHGAPGRPRDHRRHGAGRARPSP